MSEDRYPRGKLNDDDEGSLEMAVVTRDRTVIMAFKTPVAWVGMDKAGALALAARLTQHANALP